MNEREQRGVRRRVPQDYPVQPLPPGEYHSRDVATCGTCGLSWDDATPTSMTPTPAGRCPFEGFHRPARLRHPVKGVTVADLPDLIGNHRPGGDPFLLCEECFAQLSAHAGDYWDWPADRVFTHCGKPMRLVTKVVRFVDWRKPKVK